MGWQTEVTKIETVDGETVAKPPDEKGWEPIGVHDGHVVWRARFYTTEDMEVASQQADLFSGLLDVLVEQQAEERAEWAHLVQAIERDGLWKDRFEKLRDRFEELRQRFEEAGGSGHMRQVLYQRGYNAGVKKSGQPSHSDVVRWERDLERRRARERQLEALLEERPVLRGIA